MLLGISHNIAAESYMMPFAPPAYNNSPYWGGMQLGMNGCMALYNGSMPYTGYSPDPFGNPIGGMLPQGFSQGPFVGQGYSMPGVPFRRYVLEDIVYLLMEFGLNNPSL